MAFTSTESYINPQPIDETSTTQKLPTGTIIKAKDDSLGVGEFIYLKGVASTVVGSVVAFDEADVTALAAANAQGRIGVAMSANVASSFGWYQISGKAHAKVLSSFACALPEKEQECKHLMNPETCISCGPWIWGD